ncbi:FkbM family methyltransferase [Moorena sp. SIO4G3]|uniref:FkbM family methyltransferase n=1 Tax=Moorena sp. SIO4G3 TaxID=2607821 RepID=UPI0013CD587A|nr:FkbM family methyltransferase [Moorena sp. SIO4G3]NEO80255.1 FkbM family methyltransferase [Moorena sp. SIO4G3]NEO89074.1 FkbM family methyltransferase [Moorena sp. SIO3G5]
MKNSKDFDLNFFDNLALLKQQLFDLYAQDEYFKKYFLGQEILYDFFLFPTIFRKFQIQPRGVLYLGGHKGELLLQFCLSGFINILVVEPIPELLQELNVKIDITKHLLESYELLFEEKLINSIESVQCAIGNKNELGDFYVMKDNSLSSVFRPNTKVFKEQEHSLDSQINNCIVVPIKTIDNIIQESSQAFSDFNFLYLNVQGAELRALEGAKETLNHLDCIFLEKNFVARYENSPTPEELDQFILESNFIKAWEYHEKHYGVGYSFYMKK